MRISCLETGSLDTSSSSTPGSSACRWLQPTYRRALTEQLARDGFVVERGLRESRAIADELPLPVLQRCLQ